MEKSREHKRSGDDGMDGDFECVPSSEVSISDDSLLPIGSQTGA